MESLPKWKNHFPLARLAITGNRPRRGIVNKEERPRVSRLPRVPNFWPLTASFLPEPMWEEAPTILPVILKTKTPGLLPQGSVMKVLTWVSKNSLLIFLMLLSVAEGVG